MNDLTWDDENEEDPAAVEAALAKVRQTGNKKKAYRRSIAASTSAVAIVAVLALVSLNAADPDGPSNVAAPTSTAPEATEVPLSLAAKVTKAAAASLADLKSVSAKSETTTHAFDVGDSSGIDTNSKFEYRMAADGSYYYSTSLTGPHDTYVTREAYAATTGTLTRCDSQVGVPQQCSKNFGPGGFEPGFGVLADRIDAAAKAQNTSATEGNEGERKIWTLEYDVDMPLSTATQHVRITVDQDTGFPFRTVTTVNGKPDSETTLTDLNINPTFKPAELQLYIPADIAVPDGTTSKANPKESQNFGASIAAPADKVLPIGTVTGYTAKETWTTQNGRPFDVKGTCAVADAQGTYNDANSRATYARSVYRQKLSMFEVSVIDRSTCSSDLNMSDAMEDINSSELLKTVTATAGAMKGTSFQIYRQPSGQMFMGGAGNKVLLYARGEATVDQFTELVNSLRTK